MSLVSGLDDICVITLTKQGMDVAAALEKTLPAKVTVYVSEKYDADAPENWTRFPRRIYPLVDEIWGRHEAHVFVMASGIVVRAIAKHVQDKRWDPGVVVMDIRGKFAIALCSGHLGGSNELCRLIEERCEAVAVVTTGTDVNDTLAPDVLAKEIGADIENWDALKTVSGALVDGLPVGVYVEPGIEVGDLSRYEKKKVFVVDDPAALAGYRAGVVVSHRLVDVPDVPTIVLRPRNLVVGIGCNSGTEESEIAAEVDAALREAGLSPDAVRNLATFEKKKDEPGLVAYAKSRGLDLVWYGADAINAAPEFPNPSEVVLKYVGVRGVAEPAALLSAGATTLLIEKQKRGNLTVAVARAGVLVNPEPRAPDPEKRRMAQNRERVGLVIVNTGNGKGKSTASFGMAIRSAGHGMKVHIVQFIKGSRDYGELAALERFPEITLERAGEGFTWEVRSDERQEELAEYGMRRAEEAVATGDLDLLVLDEINIALGKGFYPVERLIAFLEARPEDLHVVCTGRCAPDALVEFADLVTDMELIKHPYERGIRAQPGVEF